MAIRKIIRMGHPVLRRPAEPLARPDIASDATRRLIADMIDTLHDYGGIGLAAPQVGEPIRLAIVEIPEGGASGTIICQGGRFGGWSLYMKDGKPAYDYNMLGLERSTIASATVVPPGKATIELDFAYDGGGMAKGGTGTLTVNGAQVASGRIERTQPIIFSADETADVGIDLGTPVVEAVGSEAKSRFTGKIPSVTVAIRDASAQADAVVKQALAEVQHRIE